MISFLLARAPARAVPADPRQCLTGSRRHRSGGFSLVEVTLAIGIVAAVFIPLVGMLPVALTSYRSAMDATLRANMSRQVSAQLEQAPFDQINQTRDFYFDDQGILLKDRTGARFQVNCTAADVERTLFDGASVVPTPATMKKVQMKMTSLLGTGTRFSLSTATAIIADNGLRTPTPSP